MSALIVSPYRLSRGRRFWVGLNLFMVVLNVFFLLLATGMWPLNALAAVASLTSAWYVARSGYQQVNRDLQRLPARIYELEHETFDPEPEHSEGCRHCDLRVWNERIKTMHAEAAAEKDPRKRSFLRMRVHAMEISEEYRMRRF